MKQLSYTASNLEGRSQVSQHVVIFSQEVVVQSFEVCRVPRPFP